MALASWPRTPGSWLLSWTIWRFKGAQPSSRPVSAPKEIPKYAWEFLNWCAWRRKGAMPPRPNITPKIPEWGWSMLKQLNQAVPLVPAPPPPPPLPVWENSWKLPNPIIWTAWGWLDPSWQNVEAKGQELFEMGVKTVALQIGQFDSTVPSRLREFGFKIALWGIPSSMDASALADSQADGYIPQVEGPYQYIAAINNLEAGVGEGLSLSIVTTLSGLGTFTTIGQPPNSKLTTLEAEKLKAAGCTHAWVECYKQDPNDVHFPISKMQFSAKQKGIEFFNPLVGLYWDIPLSVYEPDLNNFGRQIGAYTYETMRPIDKLDFKNL